MANKKKKIRAKQVTLSSRLYAAIEKYFLTKAENGGMFPDSQTKRIVCEAIFAAAPKFTVSIWPGMIELSDERGRAAIIVSRTLSKVYRFEENPKLPE